MSKLKYTIHNVTEEALKFYKKMDFAISSPGHYAAAKRFNILPMVCAHMKKREAPNKKWSLDTLSKEAAKSKSRQEFKINNRNAYKRAVKLGLLNVICSHMDLIKKPSNYWTFDRLREEALKYNTRMDFYNNSSTAYSTAHKMDVIEKICSHMAILWEKWDDDKAKKEALKYDTKSVFAKNSSGAYNYLWSNGILENACSHMKNSGGTSIAEQHLFDIIKTIYPKVQKLRDRKVKIEGKPYIGGFDVDIYIPELRKGIEFDGDYWHSVEGLKRSRSHWPKEDLENYHQLKDSYFKTKGIELLHISELEWNSQKELCVKKCKTFLNIGNI